MKNKFIYSFNPFFKNLRVSIFCFSDFLKTLYIQCLSMCLVLCLSSFNIYYTSFKQKAHEICANDLIGQIVPSRVISLMLMALCCLFTRRTAPVLCRPQCLDVSGSISTTRSRGRGPLLNSTTRGTTVDHRSLLKPLTLCCNPLA